MDDGFLLIAKNKETAIEAVLFWEHFQDLEIVGVLVFLSRTWKLWVSLFFPEIVGVLVFFLVFLEIVGVLVFIPCFYPCF